MKLLRIGAPGAETPAVLDGDGRMFALTGLTEDIDGAFLASGGIDRVRQTPAEGLLPPVEETGQRTGAPAGVALGLPGTPYLREGDTVELSIDGLGTQRQTFVNA